jgi:uncharacterized membrane protein YciS (DUF1049 family)
MIAENEKGGSMKNILLFVLIVVVASVSALFFAQNDSLVEIRYFGGVISWQMNWVLVSFLCFGFLFGALSFSFSLFATKVKLAGVRRKLVQCEKELANLRTLPIKGKY